MTPTPLFTIITVTYNASHTLARTIESVQAQSCTDYEHLILDGDSTDDTVDIALKYDSERLFVISEPDHGIYDAMNKGISHARGKYLIFLNSGDKFHSAHTLEHIAQAIIDNDMPGIVYGQTVIVDDEGQYLGPRHLCAPRHLTINSFKQGMVVCHQAFVANRELVPYYNLKYKYSADYEWCLICLMHSRHNVYIDDVLIDYLNEGTTTANHRKSLRERYNIMRKYFGGFTAFTRHLAFAARYLCRRKHSANCQ